MKKVLMIISVLLINIIAIGNVSALAQCTGPTYEENAFTDEECLDSDDLSWQQGTQTDYSLNKNTGEYELKGLTYEASTTSHIYYGISETGKELYAYVPNYSTIIQNQTTKDEIGQKGILTTATCSGTIKVTKTVIGVEYEEGTEIIPEPSQKPCTIVDGKYYGQEAEEVDKAQYEKECVTEQEDQTPEQEDQTPEQQSNIAPTPSTNPAAQEQTILTPDTASTVSIVSITFGTAAVAGGGYALLKRFNVMDKIGKGKKGE